MHFVLHNSFFIYTVHTGESIDVLHDEGGLGDYFKYCIPDFLSAGYPVADAGAGCGGNWNLFYELGGFLSAWPLHLRTDLPNGMDAAENDAGGS